jgi:hypothetical protein
LPREAFRTSRSVAPLTDAERSALNCLDILTRTGSAVLFTVVGHSLDGGATYAEDPRGNVVRIDAHTCAYYAPYGQTEVRLRPDTHARRDAFARREIAKGQVWRLAGGGMPWVIQNIGDHSEWRSVSIQVAGGHLGRVLSEEEFLSEYEFVASALKKPEGQARQRFVPGARWRNRTEPHYVTLLCPHNDGELWLVLSDNDQLRDVSEEILLEFYEPWDGDFLRSAIRRVVQTAEGDRKLLRALGCAEALREGRVRLLPPIPDDPSTDPLPSLVAKFLGQRVERYPRIVREYQTADGHRVRIVQRDPGCSGVVEFSPKGDVDAMGRGNWVDEFSLPPDVAREIAADMALAFAPEVR